MRDPRFPERHAQAAAPQSGERLQKVLADAGIASRRDVEFAVRAGRVRVNGRRVNALPCLVDPARDLIELDGEVIELTGRSGARSREGLYLMLNKPKGVISTARDPGGRANVVDLVRAGVPTGHRVYPVGRRAMEHGKSGAGNQPTFAPGFSTQTLHQPAAATSLPAKMLQGPAAAPALPWYCMQLAQCCPGL